MATLAPDLSLIGNFQVEIDRPGCPTIFQYTRGVLHADTIEF